MSFFDKLKRTKDRVKWFLTEKPHLRDNDNRLMANFWWLEIQDADNLSAKESSQTIFSACAILPPATSSGVRTSSIIAFSVALYLASKSWAAKTASLFFSPQAINKRNKKYF